MNSRYALHIVTIVLFSTAVAVSQPKNRSHAIFPAGVSSITIPLDIDNNIIRMKVRINGSRELRMIFDTGASMTSIDERLVKDLGLKPASDKLNGHGTGG